MTNFSQFLFGIMEFINYKTFVNKNNNFLLNPKLVFFNTSVKNIATFRITESGRFVTSLVESFVIFNLQNSCANRFSS